MGTIQISFKHLVRKASRTDFVVEVEPDLTLSVRDVIHRLEASGSITKGEMAAMQHAFVVVNGKAVVEGRRLEAKVSAGDQVTVVAPFAGG
jgi:sulfur carrier protein ThiS